MKVRIQRRRELGNVFGYQRWASGNTRDQAKHVCDAQSAIYIISIFKKGDVIMQRWVITRVNLCISYQLVNLHPLISQYYKFMRVFSASFPTSFFLYYFLYFFNYFLIFLYISVTLSSFFALDIYHVRYFSTFDSLTLTDESVPEAIMKPSRADTCELKRNSYQYPLQRLLPRMLTLTCSDYWSLYTREG